MPPPPVNFLCLKYPPSKMEGFNLGGNGYLTRGICGEDQPSGKMGIYLYCLYDDRGNLSGGMGGWDHTQFFYFLTLQYRFITGGSVQKPLKTFFRLPFQFGLNLKVSFPDALWNHRASPSHQQQRMFTAKPLCWSCRDTHSKELVPQPLENHHPYHFVKSEQARVSTVTVSHLLNPTNLQKLQTAKKAESDSPFPRQSPKTFLFWIRVTVRQQCLLQKNNNVIPTPSDFTSLWNQTKLEQNKDKPASYMRLFVLVKSITYLSGGCSSCPTSIQRSMKSWHSPLETGSFFLHNSKSQRQFSRSPPFTILA